MKVWFLEILSKCNLVVKEKYAVESEYHLVWELSNLSDRSSKQKEKNMQKHITFIYPELTGYLEKWDEKARTNLGQKISLF